MLMMVVFILFVAQECCCRLDMRMHVGVVVDEWNNFSEVLVDGFDCFGGLEWPAEVEGLSGVE